MLSTTLIRSVKRAWPRTRVDALVFRGTEGALQGNPDVSGTIVLDKRSSWRLRLGELRQLWRRYDLAFSTIPSDRARIYGWAAGRHHIGMVHVDAPRSARWLMDEAVAFDDLGTHTINMDLRLLEGLAVRACREVVPPSAGGGLPAGITARFAVLHPYPKFNYKLWREDGWVAVAAALAGRGLQLVLTGSDEPDELAYTNRIAAACGAVNLSGAISLGQAADLIRQATIYVGPDTAMTHIAAATGVPTVALFGPSNPVKWGPWPSSYDAVVSPWPMIGSMRQGNVALIQGTGRCVPCRLEGCDQHLVSFSDCLQQMPAERVIDACFGMLDVTTDVAKEFRHHS